VGIPSTVAAVYFKSEDDGDGTYEGQIGHAYLHLDDGSTGDEGRDLGFITLTAAAEIAKRQGAELDIDGRRGRSGTRRASSARSLPAPAPRSAGDVFLFVVRFGP
jgi:hypothetical protein